MNVVEGLLLASQTEDLKVKQNIGQYVKCLPFFECIPQRKVAASSTNVEHNDPDGAGQ